MFDIELLEQLSKARKLMCASQLHRKCKYRDTGLPLYLDISNAAPGLRCSMFLPSEPQTKEGGKSSLAAQLSPAVAAPFSSHMAQPAALPALSHWECLGQVWSTHCSLLHLLRPQSPGTSLHMHQVGSTGLIKCAFKKCYYTLLTSCL